VVLHPVGKLGSKRIFLPAAFGAPSGLWLSLGSVRRREGVLAGAGPPLYAPQVSLSRLPRDAHVEGLKGRAIFSDAHNHAVTRMDAAMVEEDRLGDRYRSAMGTSKEFGAYVRLRAASDDVAATEAALKSIDERDGSGGRAWVNGLEVGGTGSLFVGLEDSHD